MAPQWRLNDKARRQAIHTYIRAHREELLATLTGEALADKNTKRNELVRVGRIRFAALPSEVQARYFDESENSSPALALAGSRCSGEGGRVKNTVGGKHQTQPASRCCGEGNRVENTKGEMHQTQPAHILGSSGGDGPAVTMEVDGDAARCSSPLALSPALQHDGWSPTKNIIMEEFAFLQKTFPGPAVFDVLASAFRMLDSVSDDMPMETDRVKAAVCLGIGAKLANCGPSHTFKIWKKLTNAKMKPHLKSVELRVLARWAKTGL